MKLFQRFTGFLEKGVVVLWVVLGLVLACPVVFVGVRPCSLSLGEGSGGAVLEAGGGVDEFGLADVAADRAARLERERWIIFGKGVCDGEE